MTLLPFGKSPVWPTFNNSSTSHSDLQLDLKPASLVLIIQDPRFAAADDPVQCTYVIGRYAGLRDRCHSLSH